MYIYLKIFRILFKYKNKNILKYSYSKYITRLPFSPHTLLIRETSFERVNADKRGNKQEAEKCLKKKRKKSSRNGINSQKKQEFFRFFFYLVVRKYKRRTIVLRGQCVFRVTAKQ